MSRIHIELHETSLGIQAKASMRVRRWKWAPFTTVVSVVGRTARTSKEAARDAMIALIIEVTIDRSLYPVEWNNV